MASIATLENSPELGGYPNSATFLNVVGCAAFLAGGVTWIERLASGHEVPAAAMYTTVGGIGIIVVGILLGAMLRPNKR